MLLSFSVFVLVTAFPDGGVTVITATLGLTGIDSAGVKLNMKLPSEYYDMSTLSGRGAREEPRVETGRA